MYRYTPSVQESLPTRHFRQSGFTLIEVVVSIFVIGVMVVASAMLLSAERANRVTRDTNLALKIASNEIETLRAGGYAALPASGSLAGVDLSSLTSGAATAEVSDYDAKTKKVSVSISWLGPEGATHEVALTTLITETGGL